MKLLKLSFILFSSVFMVQAQDSPEITPPEIVDHIKYLSSDELQGRKAGTEYADQAAEYIADEFKNYGLNPVKDTDSYLQTFEITTDLKFGENNKLSFGDTDFKVDQEWIPLGFSANESVDGELAFVGYGIGDDSLFNEYENIDVNGKIVMMLRYAPKWDSTGNNLNRMAALRFKAINARENGAVAAVIVTGFADEDQGDLISLRFDNSFKDAGIPVISLSRNAAQQILLEKNLDLKYLQSKLDADTTNLSQILENLTLQIETDVIQIKNPTSNVIGVLEGTHPVLKNEYILIGGHYDHLGLGGEGALGPEGEIHNGADDNASGTTGVLELAEYFASIRERLQRSYIFMAFAAEEMGLLGSSHYANNPLIDLQQTVTMINMDMIGRMTENKVIIYGTGSATEWKELLENTNKRNNYNFELTYNAEGYGPSDHSAFYAKEIPVLFFFTGTHTDYHRPSDDWEKINSVDQARLLKYIADIVFNIDQKEEKPEYLVTKSRRPGKMGGGRRSSVYIGTIPDFSGDSRGYKISGVNEGSPAANAGLTGGDVIIKMSGQDINGIYDFMFAMQKCQAGKTVEIVFLRDNKKFKMNLTPVAPKEKKSE